ncbi:peptide chain release factor N(5)-glutamine methyltransferase [Palleronia caenipelagi]|uniref:Release factor glutamine methyltransferase n=1 Tax=Palleronia caenipelagi TaxID=2489174 RepID=A0A547Q9F7_9RHOB|nr:peptide chain release factor N(5)-glutamine methyltransferase [Palleronia caenipelagi]TRD23004.1 peptide chain release factor N(5)-glutamine methyltransferase [Palleronia caenipelagi]
MSPEVEALLAEASDRLASTGNGSREARILLAHAAGFDRSALHRLDDLALTDGLRLLFEGYMVRRLAAEPVSRILGYRDFWAHRFRITPDVLDPRPDTETLVASAFEVPFGTVLDLGTGSGCILLSLLAERPAAKGIGTDLSDAALHVARENAMEIGVAERTTFLRSDWYKEVTGPFDLIVSNPPYIAAGEMAALDRDVRGYDPEMALTPGGDGLDAYRAITAGAAAHLVPAGALMVEIGWQQGAAVRALFEDAGFANVRIVQDLSGKDRVVRGVLP